MNEFDFVVTLKQRSFKQVDNISKLMLLLSVMVFAYNAVTLGGDYRIIYGVVSAAIVIWFMYANFFATKKLVYYRLGLLIASTGWLYSKSIYSLIGVLFIIAALLEKQVKFPDEIGVDEEGMLFNSLPKRRVKWNAVTNVVIKDSLLTIDYLNNKIFQKELDSAISRQLESEFNEYCSKHIAAAKMSLIRS